MSFTSRRKWSAAQLDDVTLVLGPPEQFALGKLKGAAERDATQVGASSR